MTMWRIVPLLLLWPALAAGQAGSLFSPTGPLGGAGPVKASRVGASLFAGKGGASLFAPLPDRPPRPETDAPPRVGGAVARLRDLIASAEAGPDGYDAVQHGARIRPEVQPTRMTIAQIRAWVAATPGQPHAIGRYQFVPKTFASLVAQLSIPEDAVFTPAVQDRMAERLLDHAGLARFLRGELGRTAFMNRLARIWAGLPTSSGESYYHGYAGNRAAITWAAFEQGMARIFPAGPTPRPP